MWSEIDHAVELCCTWGEDVIYHLHRKLSLIALGLVLAHPLILFIVRPELLALLNSVRAP
jgi:predicted ferric reductase